MLTKLALRNVFRNRRRSGITLLVIVFGAVGLILFESTIRDRLVHLQIYKRGFERAEAKKPLEYGLEDVAQLRRAIERDPRVRMTTPQITLMGLVSNGDKSVRVRHHRRARRPPGAGRMPALRNDYSFSSTFQ
jgi:putative ABC transport system permease protein